MHQGCLRYLSTAVVISDLTAVSAPAAVDVILQRLHSVTLQAHGSITDDDICAVVDIEALVAGLRKQRRGTVQTSEQYAFIWQAVIDEIEVLLQQERQQQQHLQELATALRQELLVQ